MEELKGKLIVTQNAKKKKSTSNKVTYAAKIIYTNKKGKELDVSPSWLGAKVTVEDNGQDCKFELQNDGQIIKIETQDKVFCKEDVLVQKALNSNNGKQKSMNTNINNSSTAKPRNDNAKAPYNFIPLSDKPVDAEFTPENFIGHDIYAPERLSGYFEIDITAKTPLFIRGMKKNGEAEDAVNPDFFNYADRMVLPGSSIRGMIRSVMEITTRAKFLPKQHFVERNLYYRSFADDNEDFRKEYLKHISSILEQKIKSGLDPKLSMTEDPKWKMKGGYIRKEGLKYFIFPAEEENGKTFTRCRYQKDLSDKRCFEWTRQEDGKWKIEAGKGIGRENGRRHYVLMNAVAKCDNAKPIEISFLDIESYENDTKRDKRGELLQKVAMDKFKEDGVPCFYYTWKDEDGNARVNFGHTLYFRLAYECSIADHVPAPLKNKEHLDMVEAIFGKLENFAGRVYFEDCVSQKKRQEEITTPKILSTPRPTTIQHYLEQNYGGINNGKLINWNDKEKNIRGYKRYWHRETPNNSSQYGWQANPADVNRLPKQYTQICPVEAGTKFTGRIRFDNLSQAELGALLFVLKLPEGCYHKLGMGKPLGLGTVKLESRLNIIERNERYSKIFDNVENDSDIRQWNEAVTCSEDTRINECIDAFQNYMCSQLGVDQYAWKSDDRLKELEIMMDYSHTEKEPKDEWLELTRYLEIKGQEYKPRNNLAIPSAFIKKT